MIYENKQIKDICEFIGGSQPPKKSFKYTKEPGYIRLYQIRDRLNDKFATFIPANSTKKVCHPNDILIGRYGPPIFQIFRGFEGAYNVAIMKACPLNNVDNDYLYYFLKQDSILKYVESMSLRTAGQTGVELDSLYEYPVMLPQRKEQIKIASILKSLDDKIENNNKINSELESMAKTLYDYWFLQFEFPNEEGKPYKSSGGKMVWNEELKREIPEGWNVKHLGDFLTLLKDGTHNPPKRVEEGIPLLTGTMFGSSFLNYDEATYITEGDYKKIHSQYKPEYQDMIITKIGTLGYVNYLAKEDLPIAIHCNSALLRFPNDYAGLYALMYLKSNEFYKRLKAAKGQSIQEFVSLDKIASIISIIPDGSIAKKFNDFSKNILDYMLKIRKENQELSSLRDFLLPLLMNGQATFKEV